MTTAALRRRLLDLRLGDLRAELAQLLQEQGEPPYRASQILEWVYRKTPGDFGEMSSLPRRLREALAAAYVLHPIEPKEDLRSRDGTRKLLWSREGGGNLESVMIPDGSRVTYCISTQAGCPVRCTFCATGYGGFQGQLSAGEIVDQVLGLRRATGTSPTNVVFMGMGEPLLNLPGVLGALSILTSAEQVGIGDRRITVSSVGIPDRIRELGHAFPQVKLALSLHAPDDALRTELVPLNRAYPLADVLAATREHAAETGKKVTFEYVVLPGVNDSEAQARAVGRLVRDIPSRINLIGFNPFPGAPYGKPSVQRLLGFRRWVEAAFPGEVTIRRSRGEDIQGACGQLSLAARKSAASPPG